MKFAFLLVFVNFFCQSHGFNRYSCQGGLSTPCADITPAGKWHECVGKDAQCYQAIIYYQNGAIRYVQRRCWIPPKNSTSQDFCKTFNNPNGKIIHCETCKSDLCNMDLYNHNNKNGSNGYFIKRKSGRCLEKIK